MAQLAVSQIPIPVPDEWDSLSPALQDNLRRQHREGGLKSKNIPLLSGRVDATLKPHSDTISDIKEKLAEVEKAADAAELKADFVKCRDEKRALVTQLVLATEAKKKARTADADYGELTHCRATVRASEFMRMKQVTGILGNLKYEQKQESDDTEIAEFEHAQSVAASAAKVVGVLDLALFK
uniref:Uncharacterized protein n=1 Tax=viral metagenome TaxID=1070528 RepID=A0A6M3LT20_9ZZZZ